MFHAFKHDNKDIQLVLLTGHSKKVCNMALNNQIDFGFNVGDTIVNGLTSRVLTKLERVFVVSPQHPLANKASVTKSELSAYPFVLMATEFGTHNVIEMALTSFGVELKSKLMEIEDSDGIKRVVERGSGVGVLLAVSVAEELRAGILQKVSLSGDPMLVNLRIVWPLEKTLSPTQKMFLTFSSSYISSRLSKDTTPSRRLEAADLAGPRGNPPHGLKST